MRLALHLLGHEVIAIEVDRPACGAESHEDEPEAGPPFGFSGGSFVQAERAEDAWTPEEGGG